ncbi:hypothetical protein [Rhizobium paknamense]|uniref:Uncharacterized protein n=1 Tax=Rhizobium paknamense TaxID=1206817 RepID=A0ABU0ICQ9_9HYPH|nr:hypothetical protein [Rhizobium paknamense]MDQ0456034.1 hypothetical protein [Rhizobium paknamense]
MWELIVIVPVLAVVAFAIVHQLSVQVNEYRFYQSVDWDFSIDSKIDRLNIDERMFGYSLNLTNWQRFYLFRPFFIFILLFVLVMMIVSLF